MNKPSLIIVTGRPASGKTTLAKVLSDKISFPLVSRDKIKEGLVNTLKTGYNGLGTSADLHVYDTFFEAIGLLVSKSISLIAEAAFQDKLWRPKLISLADTAEIKVIVCTADSDVIKSRFTGRLLKDPEREKYHEDRQVILSEERYNHLIENYQAVDIGVPILQVDTSYDYNPGMAEIISFIAEHPRS